MQYSFKWCRLHSSLLFACIFALAGTGLQAKKDSVTENPVVTEKIPRPAVIWVYAFASSPEEIPDTTALAPLEEGATPLTESEIATDVALGSEMATELVAQINDLGLSSKLADARSTPAIDDIVLRGYFLSMTEGSSKKRMIIGLGSGAAELKVAMEGFEVTETGMRSLGWGTESGKKGGYSPGVGIGLLSFAATKNPLSLIVSAGMKHHKKKTGKDTLEGKTKDVVTAITDALKIRFEEQGWLVTTQ